MPELPEVETVCRGLAVPLSDSLIIGVHQNRPDLRIPFPKDMGPRVCGKTVTSVYRKAKYIVIDLSSDESLIMHLGMSGRILIQNPIEDVAKHDHMALDLKDGTRIVFNDPRRFGMVDMAETANIDDHRFFAHLGPEPLGNGFNAKNFHDRIKNKRTAIKTALLDQRIVVGVGNIYAAEALFHAGVHPERLCHTITTDEAEKLVRAVRDVLNKAIEAGGSSLKDYVKADGELGYFQHSWAVYGRAGEPCHTCKTEIEKITQGGRSTFYCPSCQV